MQRLSLERKRRCAKDLTLLSLLAPVWRLAHLFQHNVLFVVGVDVALDLASTIVAVPDESFLWNRKPRFSSTWEHVQINFLLSLSSIRKCQVSTAINDAFDLPDIEITRLQPTRLIKIFPALLRMKTLSSEESKRLICTRNAIGDTSYRFLAHFLPARVPNAFD